LILIDERARTLALGVEDLIDAGAAGAAFGAVEPTRARLEARAREAFAEGARVDLRLATELDWRGFRVALDGRADVVRESPRGARVECLCFVPDDDEATSRARAVERAGFASLLLALGGERVAGASVVTLSLLGDAPTRSRVAIAHELWATRLEERLEHVARAAQLDAERASERRTFEPRFPFEAVRPVQTAMLAEVEGAAASGLVLLCSAPTGVGKTAAALYPFLADALRHDRRVFFVTSKTSQQELALDTLRRMLPPEGGALAVQISAKDRVCPMAQLRCAERPCPWQRQFSERLAATGVADQLAREGVLSAERIAERAREHELCPFETSLALATRSSAVVCDFNYVFDPRVYLRRFFDDPDGRDLLIVDEAHNLAERAQAYFSPELELAKLDALAERCAALPERAYARAAALLSEVSAHCRATAQRLAEERGDDGPWVESPERGFWEPVEEEALACLLEVQAQAASEAERPASLAPVREGRDGRLRDPLRSALGLVREFAHGSEADDPLRFAALWSPERAKRLCLDPAPWLGRRIRSFHAAVLMSATLAPLDFHARALGVDAPSTVRLDLPSPFPRENRLIVAVDSVDTRFRVRSEHAGAIADLIARGLRTRRGNWLAFFPSFAFRDEVVAKLPPGEQRVLLQMPGMPIEPILAKLRANRSETLLVCGVQGGMLAEGVDYPGELAIGVFVVGPGLPKLERERELVRAFFEAELGAGFDYAYLLPGLARSVQAAGRVLRGPDDVAAIVLVDRRFCEPQYRDRLPAWFREELVQTADPVPALEAFWRARSRAARVLPSSGA
jgi:DNA excision repair protein ERCC-2